MKNKNKMMKKIFTLALLLMAAGKSSAQLDLSKVVIDYQKITDDQIFCDAVEPSLSIIRQQYRLERDGQYYGKNKQSFYGETYTMAVKVAGGALLCREVPLPWEHDADYKRVNQNGQYKPKLMWSMQRGLNEEKWEKVELELGTRYVTPVGDDSLLFHHADATADFGLVIDDEPGTKHGFMIWMTSKTNATDSCMQVSLSQANLEIEAKADSLYTDAKPEDAEKTVGGIFVVPQIERPGYIRLALVGMAVKQTNLEWALCLLTKKEEQAEKDYHKVEPRKEKPRKQELEDELTPIE